MIAGSTFLLQFQDLSSIKLYFNSFGHAFIINVVSQKIKYFSKEKNKILVSAPNEAPVTFHNSGRKII